MTFSAWPRIVLIPERTRSLPWSIISRALSERSLARSTKLLRVSSPLIGANNTPKPTPIPSPIRKPFMQSPPAKFYGFFLTTGRLFRDAAFLREFAAHQRCTIDAPEIKSLLTNNGTPKRLRRCFECAPRNWQRDNHLFPLEGVSTG